MLDVDNDVIEIEEPLDYISPYKPKILDATEYQLSRLLCGGRRVKGQFGDQAFTLCAQPIDKKIVAVSPRYFKVTLEQCEFIVELGLDVLQFALSQLKISDAVEHLSSTLCEAALVAALESFLGQSFGIDPLQIKAVRALQPSSRHHLFSFNFLSGEDSDRVGLHINVAIHVDFLPRVVEWFAVLEPAGKISQKVLQHIKIVTEFILDEFFIAQTMVESLRYGDVIVIDAKSGEVFVRVGQKQQQKGKLMDESITLDGYLQDFEQELPQSMLNSQIDNSLADVSSCLHVKSDTSQDQVDSYDAARDLFQDIPLLMKFQLSEQEFTIEQLRALNAGQCLPIKNTSPSEIKISVNGVTFAQGKLVQVEEQLGVRIEAFMSP